MKKLLFLIGLLLILTILPIPEAMACTGAPEFPIDDLAMMDVWVKATVIDTDDRGFNAIIRVEAYYKGQGEQLLTVIRYPVALENGANARGYDTSCLYAGRGHQWQKGSQGYFGLNSNGNGTFTDSLWTSAHFYVWDGQITHHDGVTTGYALEHSPPFSFMSEIDFLAKLRDMGGYDTPILPTIDDKQFYPLMRLLNITTETGTRYQINPDRSLSQLPDDAPLAISPDGAYVAFKLDENTIAFQTIWTEYGYVDETSEPLPLELMEDNQKKGKHVRFSNDSNMVAVWDDAYLTVYLLDSQEVSYFGNQLHMREIVTVPIGVSRRVIWSADSSTIAWEDTLGVWRWNLFNDAEPMHLTESYQLLDLSTYGRYVRIGDSLNWTLYDTQTGETFDNAIAAPTENFLIFVDVDDAPIHDWRSDFDCQPPLRDTCAVYINPSYQSSSGVGVFPYQMELIAVGGCSPETEGCLLDAHTWHPSFSKSGSVHGRYINVALSDVRQIIYDVFYDQPAILRGDYQIEFAFYNSHVFTDEAYQNRLDYYDYVNLEDELDSPIASIEWGQPIFYDTFMMTATGYLP